MSTLVINRSVYTHTISAETEKWYCIKVKNTFETENFLHSLDKSAGLESASPVKNTNMHDTQASC